MRRLLGLALVTGLLACAGGSTPAQDISPEELLTLAASATPPLILDVRSADEYAHGHVPGAVNIPHDQVAARLAELDKNPSRDIVVYCESGHRAGMALAELRDSGFENTRHLAGDMAAWRAAGRATE